MGSVPRVKQFFGVERSPCLQTAHGLGMALDVKQCRLLIRGSTPDEAANDIINVQLPDIRHRLDAGELHVDNIDVFCEEGVFNVDQTRRILTAGQAAGLAANFHGEELHCLHSAEVTFQH